MALNMDFGSSFSKKVIPVVPFGLFDSLEIIVPGRGVLLFGTRVLGEPSLLVHHVFSEVEQVVVPPGFGPSPGFLVGILALAAVVMASVNSTAALSRRVVTDELWPYKKFEPSSLVLSPVNSGELIVGLNAMFVRRDEEKRSQFASLVLYPAAGNGLLTLSGVQVPVTNTRIPL
jgi:hypothetical protein